MPITGSSLNAAKLLITFVMARCQELKAESADTLGVPTLSNFYNFVPNR
jgi:hypothetical protein